MIKTIGNLNRAVGNLNRTIGFLMVALLGGCSLVSIDSKTRYSDASGFFESRLLDEIRPDETTRDWLHQHFGEPLFVDRDFNNPMAATEQVQIETWRFVRYQQKNTRVFLLFSSRKRHEDSEYLHVVLADNRVVKAWRDRLETVDTRRVMGVLGYAPVATQSAKPRDVTAPPVADAQLQAEGGVPPPAALEVQDVKPDAAENAEPDPEPDSTSTQVPSPGPAKLGYSPTSI